MINSSFSTQISQREFDENVTDDYISGFKENITKYNMKRVRIAGLSPYDSMISEGVFDEREQREDNFQFNDISFISFEFQNKETDESIVKSDSIDFDQNEYSKMQINDSKIEENSISTNDEVCSEDKIPKFNIMKDEHNSRITNNLCFEYHNNPGKKLRPKGEKWSEDKCCMLIKLRSRAPDIKNYYLPIKKI